MLLPCIYHATSAVSGSVTLGISATKGIPVVQAAHILQREGCTGVAQLVGLWMSPLETLRGKNILPRLLVLY